MSSVGSRKASICFSVQDDFLYAGGKITQAHEKTNPGLGYVEESKGLEETSEERSYRWAEVEIGWYSREVVPDEITLDITGLL